MVSLFGINFTQVVGSALQGQLVPMTLIKVSFANRDPSNLSGGRSETRTSFSCEGFIEVYENNIDVSRNVLLGTRQFRIYILAISTSQTPEPNDLITVENQSYTITDQVSRDPGGVGFSCLTRLV